MVVSRSIRIFPKQCSDPNDHSDEYHDCNKQANPLQKRRIDQLPQQSLFDLVHGPFLSIARLVRGLPLSGDGIISKDGSFGKNAGPRKMQHEQSGRIPRWKDLHEPIVAIPFHSHPL